MIQVTVYRNSKQKCEGFVARGHAGYSEEGQDIVCAAASVLIMNTVNAVEKYTDDRFSVVSDDEEGLIDFKLKDRPSAEAALLLDAMILGLRDMADDENYAKYIQLTFEGV